MKKFIASVLVLAFLNLVIAPEFASAGTLPINSGGSIDLPLSRGAAVGAAAIIVGVVAAIAGLVYLAKKSGGQKTKKPEEQKPEDINKNIENLQPRSENDGLETTPVEQKPGDPNQTIENLQLRTEKDSLETTQVPKSDGLPVTQSGELVILKW